MARRWHHDAMTFDVQEVDHVLDALIRSTVHWQRAFRLWLVCWMQCAEEYGRGKSKPGASMTVPGTRVDLARDMGCTEAELSRLMTALEKVGIISRERSQPDDPDCRVRGRGFVTYTIHHVRPN